MIDGLQSQIGSAAIMSVFLVVSVIVCVTHQLMEVSRVG